MLRMVLIIVAAIAVFALTAGADDSGRIYGKITTTDGDEFQGFIRWDKNEGSWVDILDATKEMPKEKAKKSRRKYRDRETTIEIFGLKIGSSGSSTNWWSTAQSGIRFGHIKMLEVIDDDGALLTLKSGEEVEFREGSTDIGDGIREIVIEDENDGEIELVWDDLEMIEFMDAPTDEESIFGERLYGTLMTRRGDEFTGWVCWDVDELFPVDILDGEDNRRSRKIKFGKIASIERYSSSGATVTLKNGDEVVLRGTNDVDDDNRGIAIMDPALGQVIVKWDEFDRLDFTDSPEPPVRYKDFDGGRHLRGTVYDEDGDSFEGAITWDNDEEFTWELLDGDYRDISFDIEFGFIKSIEKKSFRSSIVTLRDGRSFRLSGSNDIDEDNRGIFISLIDGDEVEVEWEDFQRVEFD
ncbi:MAG: hypothetical protein ABII79_03015 [bacterium]